MEVRPALLLATLLLLPCGHASASEESGRKAFVGKKIAGVVLVTPPGKGPGDLARFLEVRQGDLYTSAAVRRTIEVLSKLGDFADVRVEAQDTPSGVFLTIRLTPVARVARIVLSGVSAGPERVAAALGVSEGDPYPGEQDLARMGDDLRNAYVRDAWLEAKASVKAVVLPGGDVELDVAVEEGARHTVGDVEFTGDLAFTPETLLKECGLSKGDPITEPALNDVRERVVRYHRKAGFLEVRVAPPVRQREEPGSPQERVSFEVTSGEQIRIAIHARSVPWADQKQDLLWWWNFRERKLKSLLDLAEESQFTEGWADEASRTLAAWYRKHGYLEAKVTWAPPEVQITKRLKSFRFDIDPGRRFRLGDLVFKGNDEKKPGQSARGLRGALEAAAPSLEDGLYVPEELEPGLEQLVNGLRSQGYTEAHVEAEEPVIDHERRRVNLLIHVDAGGRSTVGSISFEGNKAVGSAQLADFLQGEAVGLKPGDPLNAVYLDRADAAIAQYYGSIGYPYVKVSHTATAGVAGAVAIRFQVEESFQAFIGRVIIRGNRYTQRDVIERALPFKTGQTYTPQAMTAGQEAIYRLGVFTRVTALPYAAEDPERVRDIVVAVTEGNRTSLEPSLGVSSERGPGAKLAFTRKNLWGTAKSISVRYSANWLWSGLLTQGFTAAPVADTTKIEHRLLLTYNQPTTFDSPVGTTVNANLYERVSNRAYGYIGNRLALIFDRDLKLDSFPFRGAAVKLLARYQLFLRDTLYFSGLNGQDERAVAVDQADLSFAESQLYTWPLHWRTGSVAAAAFVDNRNNRYNPSDGYSLIAEMELASAYLASDFDFAKLTASWSLFRPAPSGWTIAFHTRGGLAVPYNSTRAIPIEQRFHLGGTGSVRGFYEDGVGPRFSNETFSTGADLAASYALEARHGFFLGTEGVLFTDAGWGEILHASGADSLRYGPYIPPPPLGPGGPFPPTGALPGQLTQPTRVATSVGVGLRYHIPSIGPVKFDVGVDTTRLDQLTLPTRSEQFLSFSAFGDALAGWDNVITHFTIGDF